MSHPIDHRSKKLRIADPPSDPLTVLLAALALGQRNIDSCFALVRSTTNATRAS